MKKYRIVNKYRFTFSIMLITMVLVSMGSLLMGAYDSEGAEIIEYIEVEVETGDTVWAIAKTINDTYLDNSEDIRLVAYAISKENNLEDYRIYPGQTILVPISELT